MDRGSVSSGTSNFRYNDRKIVGPRRLRTQGHNSWFSNYRAERFTLRILCGPRSWFMRDFYHLDSPARI